MKSIFRTFSSALIALFLLVVLVAVYAMFSAPFAQAQNTAIYRSQGGATEVVGSGGTLTIASGGIIDVASGGTLKIAGSAVTPTAAQLNEQPLSLDIADGSAEATYYL